jgi:hypothetical protein
MSEEGYPSVWSKVLVHAIWISGLFLPSIQGLFARAILQSRGVPTVSLIEGFQLIVPVTAISLIPFAILAVIVRRILIGFRRADRWLWLGWNIVSAGALVGLFAAVSVYLLEPMLSRSFLEAISMMMMLWFVTLPVLIAYAVGGAFVGGALGSLLALCLSYAFPGWFRPN